MPLTALKIAKAQPDAVKPLRLFDGRGLYLEIAPSGGKWWRLKYRIGGKEKRLSLGVYSAAGSKTVETSLEAARKAAEDARRLVKDGIDPSQKRKVEKLRSAHQSAIDSAHKYCDFVYLGASNGYGTRGCTQVEFGSAA